MAGGHAKEFLVLRDSDHKLDHLVLFNEQDSPLYARNFGKLSTSNSWSYLVIVKTTHLSIVAYPNTWHPPGELNHPLPLKIYNPTCMYTHHPERKANREHPHIQNGLEEIYLIISASWGAKRPSTKSMFHRLFSASIRISTGASSIESIIGD